jgi:hypothetical protein
MALGLAFNEWPGTDRLKPTVLVDITLKPGVDGFERKRKWVEPRGVPQVDRVICSAALCNDGEFHLGYLP